MIGHFPVLYNPRLRHAQHLVERHERGAVFRWRRGEHAVPALVTARLDQRDEHLCARARPPSSASHAGSAAPRGCFGLGVRVRVGCRVRWLRVWEAATVRESPWGRR